MLQVCIFVPYLHEETPKPQMIPKSELRLDYLKPDPDLIESILRLRQTIIEKIAGQPSQDELLMSTIHQQLLMTGIPEQEPSNEDEEYIPQSTSEKKSSMHSIFKNQRTSLSEEQPYSNAFRASKEETIDSSLERSENQQFLEQSSSILAESLLFSKEKVKFIQDQYHSHANTI